MFCFGMIDVQNVTKQSIRERKIIVNVRTKKISMSDKKTNKKQTIGMPVPWVCNKCGATNPPYTEKCKCSEDKKVT